MTPGAVGFAWFVGQRSWRAVAEALVTTAALTGISYAAMPQQWWDWVEFLTSRSGASPSALGLVMIVMALTAAIFGG